MEEFLIMMIPKLNIVVPCYNEEEVLPETIRQLSELITKMIGKGLISDQSSMLLVDDGSHDDTWKLIDENAASSSLVRGVKLSRNRGHQNALLAGLSVADADAIVSIDADLQDDISVIEDMVEKYHRGFDIVYGVRNDRTSDSFFKRFSAESFYRVLAIMGVETIFNHADYRLLSRRALEALKSHNEVNLYIRGVIPTLGFKSCEVPYERKERFAGESKYPLSKMLVLAFDGITSFSAVPLRLIGLLGILIFLISMLISGWALYISLFTDKAIPGWASSVLPMYVLGGVQLLSLGVVGEYVAKVYIETKRRPRFFIEEIL